MAQTETERLTGEGALSSQSAYLPDYRFLEGDAPIAPGTDRITVPLSSPHSELEMVEFCAYGSGGDGSDRRCVWIRLGTDGAETPGF
jgi:hypothetical protein